MNNKRIEQFGLQVGQPLVDVIELALVDTGVESRTFWQGLASLVREFSPRNTSLLERRRAIQESLDTWHRAHRGKAFHADAYKATLKELGYIVDEGPDFHISTGSVDPEITTIPGPQLVVPITNARFALNAANARWGSLYDALYGSDVIPETNGAKKTAVYTPRRGTMVVDWVTQFLDDIFPLQRGSHIDAKAYIVEQAQLLADIGDAREQLRDSSQFVGYRGNSGSPSAVLLLHNGLHVEIQIDAKSPIGKLHPAGVKDVLMEAAITTIQDYEDSIAAVDAQDKAAVYRNWLGLMKGDLQELVVKDGKSFTRKLCGDREYKTPDGSVLRLPGRSLMLVRNVGLHMTTPAVLDSTGHEIFEGILDALCTATIALHDLKRNGLFTNSRAGSIYIVKPKIHGPTETRFTVDLFLRVEEILGLPANTIKLGLMDEERRTSVNLKACIGEASRRIIFINTGFLDRTGDEIRTSMEAGPMVPKAEMKTQRWLKVYEDNNVDTGLAAGLAGRAQIGKGMWTAPDNMAEMMRGKISQLMAGANTAWVPSPTAAVLHATHYHRCDVVRRQGELAKRHVAYLDDLLTIPLLERTLSAEEIKAELDNNCQGILGYVVRWIQKGVGCSKVPDITGTPLMEDRATCRISSQHVANWLHHGIVDDKQVLEALERMAVLVDRQNEAEADYACMTPNTAGSNAFQAACDLIFKGIDQPNGYTELILHTQRLKQKAAHGGH